MRDLHYHYQLVAKQKWIYLHITFHAIKNKLEIKTYYDYEFPHGIFDHPYFKTKTFVCKLFKKYSNHDHNLLSAIFMTLCKGSTQKYHLNF